MDLPLFSLIPFSVNFCFLFSQHSATQQKLSWAAYLEVSSPIIFHPVWLLHHVGNASIQAFMLKCSISSPVIEWTLEITSKENLKDPWGTCWIVLALLWLLVSPPLGAPQQNLGGSGNSARVIHLCGRAVVAMSKTMQHKLCIKTEVWTTCITPALFF